MTTSRKVAVIVGSLRKESLSRKIALAVGKLAPGSNFDIVEIGDFPLYNEDLEVAGAPAPWQRFRSEIQGADAVLFVTPEYNRSVPAALKNALDVGSRPYGRSVWDGKPGAVISISMGAIGGFGANHHLRQSLVALNVPVMQQPEAYIGNAGGLFSGNGALANPETGKFLTQFMDAFSLFANRYLSSKPTTTAFRSRILEKFNSEIAI